ncbi:MAG: hypothetical protein AAGG68_20035 [Bacteroidota bacterium]
MKTVKFLFVFVLATLSLVSCSKETLEKEEGVNIAAEVEGIYVGTIVSNELTIIDTYEVTVTRLENDRIVITGDQIPDLETNLVPQENPNGAYYASPWQTVEEYAVAYWLESKELVFTIYDGEINYIGDKQ